VGCCSEWSLLPFPLPLLTVTTGIPYRRLQMEQLAVTGEAEPSALVADRMRLIFTTLEAVDPRWGGLKDYPTL